MSARRLIKILLLVAMVFSVMPAVPAAAHDLNLGGSKWCLGPDRLLFTVELGSALFPQINTVDRGGYDLDSLSEEQLQSMATAAIQPYIDEKLAISVNERPYRAQVERLEREGTLWKIWLKVGPIDFDRQDNQLKIDYRLLFEETKGDHVNVGMVYHADVADAEVQRVFDTAQPDGRYTFEAGSRVWEFSVAAKAPWWSGAFDFLKLGVEHILTGFDHIAFLLALLVIGLSFREALKIISSFTVAHSITLLLAALDVISLNARFVEIVIALSICYIALENIFDRQVNYRWLVAFVFGLIHGFGFAGALREFIAGKAGLVLSVVSFNAGVELGQLAIFAVALPLLYLLRQKFTPRSITAGASAAILLLGLFWLAERAFNLQLVSF